MSVPAVVRRAGDPSASCGVRPQRRRRALTAAAVTVSAWCTLVGCSSGQHAQTASQVPDTPGIEASAGTVVLDDVYVQTSRPVPAGGSVPLRMALSNESPRADRLVAVTSPQAASVEVLDTEGHPTGDGIPLPADGSLDATTGPARLLVTGLTGPLEPMGTVTVTFDFAHAGSLTLQARAGTPQ